MFYKFEEIRDIHHVRLIILISQNHKLQNYRQNKKLYVIIVSYTMRLLVLWILLALGFWISSPSPIRHFLNKTRAVPRQWVWDLDPEPINLVKKNYSILKDDIRSGSGEGEGYPFFFLRNIYISRGIKNMLFMFLMVLIFPYRKNESLRRCPPNFWGSR